MTYDLLISGGHVLDPGQAMDGTFDIAVNGDRIAAVSPHIDPSHARRVMEVRGANRRVVPGLIDAHTHVAFGAATVGLGMLSCEPDIAGVRAGVTTVLDAGSVGVAHVGVLRQHVLPRAITRIVPYANVATHAHSTPGHGDVRSVGDIDEAAIDACMAANPGLVRGFKLRMLGEFALEHFATVVDRSVAVARRHGVPLMVHIGDPASEDPQRAAQASRYVVERLGAGDILTHVATPHPGGTAAASPANRVPIALLMEARQRGVVLDTALGAGNFAFDTCRRQVDMGLVADTISSDLTASNRAAIGNSLVGCMARYMAVGYTLADVIRMTTIRPAQSLGLDDRIGAVKVGHHADLSIIDIVPGKWSFTDALQQAFVGDTAIVPVHTIKGGDVHAPDWGPYPWGWHPPEA